MKKLFLYSGLVSLLFLGACKPTEKGYKSAYDAAVGKREAAVVDLGVNLPDGALQQVDGAQLREIDGVKVYVLNQRLKPVEEGKSLPGSYNVAVGSYKMITNCRSQCADLTEQGFEAFPAQEPDGMYYSIAGSFPELSESVKLYQRLQKDTKRVFVGLPGAPVIIYSPVSR